MRKKPIFLLALLVFGLFPGNLYAKQTLVAKKVEKAPVIDGKASDPAWAVAQGITTHDNIANIDVILKAAYTDKEIFFLVTFPDPNESRTHKSWTWIKEKKLYEMGPDREDVLVLKWDMRENTDDLSIYTDKAYTADIWFWKAHRTDPVGHADDKIQILSTTFIKDSVNLESKSGKTMYLLRKGDSGTSAYKTKLEIEYIGDVVNRFINIIPSGNRADIKAKGDWKDGKWTIEFGRALNTGNDDDIRFDVKKKYTFGVSRYEIAGRKPNPNIAQPFYGSGDTGEILTLQFAVK